MNLVIPSAQLLALIPPHAPLSGNAGRPPFATEVMLRIHLLQQFFWHSNPAMEEALYDIPLYREFAQLDVDISGQGAWAKVQKKAPRDRKRGKSAKNLTLVSPYTHSLINSRFGESYAD